MEEGESDEVSSQEKLSIGWRVIVRVHRAAANSLNIETRGLCATHYYPAISRLLLSHQRKGGCET